MENAESTIVGSSLEEKERGNLFCRELVDSHAQNYESVEHEEKLCRNAHTEFGFPPLISSL